MMPIRLKKLLLRISFILACGLGVFALILGTRIALTTPLLLQNYQHPNDADHYVALPLSSANFQTNSYINYGVGRYYLKGKTAATLLAAYQELELIHPEWQFTYAETGWDGGGRFRPHRTHKDGMSADFMTPVSTQDAHGKATSTSLPTHILNLWGYAIRLDEQGWYKQYQMNTEALIAHIAALDHAGKAYQVRIKRVILDPPMLKLLQAHPDFGKIQHINFMQGRAWFPHDGHYHIDFQ